MKKLFALLLTPVLCLSLCACGVGKSDAVTNPVLTAVFPDAGKADAILLTNEAGNILIDTGTQDNAKDLVDELQNYGIDTLDVLILTHFDKDHVGGAAKVLKKLTVNRVLQSDCPQNSDEYDDYCSALKKAGLTAETVTGAADVTLTLGKDVVLTVNGPSQTEYGADESNNSSLIVSLQAGQNTMLLTGDAEDERLGEFLSGNTVSHIDVIKLPHHGTWQTTDKAMLSQLTPAAAIVCGPDRDDMTDLAFKEAGVPLYFTDDGAVTVLFGEKSFQVSQGENG